MCHKIFHPYLTTLFFCILHSSTPQCPHLKTLCASLAMCHALLLQNCLRIRSVLTSSSSHVVVNLLAPHYHPSTFDTIHNMLNGYNIFPSFPWPTFQQWHWSPHNMDINNPWFMVLKSEKDIISYQFVASKSLIIILKSSTYSHQCILLLLCLIDFTKNSSFCDVLFLYNCTL